MPIRVPQEPCTDDRYSGAPGDFFSSKDLLLFGVGKDFPLVDLAGPFSAAFSSAAAIDFNIVSFPEGAEPVSPVQPTKTTNDAKSEPTMAFKIRERDVPLNVDN